MRKIVASGVLVLSLFLSFSAFAGPREQVISDFLKKLRSEDLLLAIEAAEVSLRSDDRVVVQMIIEPVLQHNDRRVRQVGFNHIANKMRTFHISVDIPDDLEEKISNKRVINYFKDNRNISVLNQGYDEKMGIIKTDSSGISARVDQSGLIIKKDPVIFQFREASSGYILGAVMMEGFSLPAKIPLP